MHSSGCEWGLPLMLSHLNEYSRQGLFLDMFFYVWV